MIAFIVGVILGFFMAIKIFEVENQIKEKIQKPLKELFKDKGK